MVTPAEPISVSLSYADWLAQQQQSNTTVPAVFADGSTVVFSVFTHETRLETTAPAQLPDSEVSRVD